MKELKISISDELYEELSNVPDKDSFLIELLENKLKMSDDDNTGSVEDADEPFFEEPKDIAEMADDAPDGDAEDEDLVAEVTDSEVSCEEITGDTHFEPEDFIEGEGLTSDKDYDDDKLAVCCNCSLVDPDDLENCKEPVLDVDFADPGGEGAVSVPELMPSSEKENNPSVEKMTCFESIIVDLTDRICELENQISNMSANVQFLKDRSILSDMGDGKGEHAPSSPALSGGAVAEIPAETVPYATLSFPELKIPPELLHDIECSTADIEQDDAMVGPIESSYVDVSKSAVGVEEPSFPEPLSKASLFDAEISSQTSLVTSSQTPKLFSEGEVPSFLQDSEVPADNIGDDAPVEAPAQASKPDAPVPDVNVPPADKLESCIFAYLPSGSEVKKDVIKSLLSKRYVDSEVESKIEQLLSAGKISNVVKDDRVYLMRLLEK